MCCYGTLSNLWHPHKNMLNKPHTLKMQNKAKLTMATKPTSEDESENNENKQQKRNTSRGIGKDEQQK